MNVESNPLQKYNKNVIYDFYDIRMNVVRHFYECRGENTPKVFCTLLKERRIHVFFHKNITSLMIFYKKEIHNVKNKNFRKTG